MNNIYLTSEQKYDYLMCPYHCPVCESGNIETYHMYSDDLVYHYVRCNACKKHWREVYRMEDVELDEEE